MHVVMRMVCDPFSSSPSPTGPPPRAQTHTHTHTYKLPPPRHTHESAGWEAFSCPHTGAELISCSPRGPSVLGGHLPEAVVAELVGQAVVQRLGALLYAYRGGGEGGEGVRGVEERASLSSVFFSSLGSSSAAAFLSLSLSLSSHLSTAEEPVFSSSLPPSPLPLSPPPLSL